MRACLFVCHAFLRMPAFVRTPVDNTLYTPVHAFSHLARCYRVRPYPAVTGKPTQRILEPMHGNY